ncbi:MAG TPA: ATP-binding cassette domain-containing protein [Longimicrobiales bacterium]|nr:ATP-binding cassette domain-containing protein [Longimicrobiales bacterium]
MSILLRDVHKAFGPKRVLAGVDLEVREGETMAVIGYSGAGKSVLLKSVVGLLMPDRGTVEVDGARVDEMTREELTEMRRKIGYVFQFAALFDSMTIAENVAMGLHRIPGMSPEEIDGRVASSLASVELADYGDRVPSELSGGQRKRAGLARAIATRPKYLLYDEPTTGLDPVTTAVIDSLIKKMDEELGVTSVVITHDMRSAGRVSDRIAMLFDGAIRWVGTPADLETTQDPVVRAFVEGRPDLAGEAA